MSVDMAQARRLCFRLSNYVYALVTDGDVLKHIFLFIVLHCTGKIKKNEKA